MNIFEELCEEIEKMETVFKSVLSIPILFGQNIKTDDIEIKNINTLLHSDNNNSDLVWVDVIKSYTEFVLTYLVDNFDSNNNKKISFFANITKSNIENLKEYCEEYTGSSDLVKKFIDIIICDCINKIKFCIKSLESNIWESDLYIINKIDFRELYSEYLKSVTEL